MTPPKTHYQCWTASDTASDTCIHEDREEDCLCTGCARRYGAAQVVLPVEEAAGE